MDYVSFGNIFENFGTRIGVCYSIISDIDIETYTTVADLSGFPNFFN